MQWFRWHVGTCENTKFRIVSRNAAVTVSVTLGVWASLLEDAARNDGVSTSGIDFHATILDLPEEDLKRILDAMEGRKLITQKANEIQILSWDRRQYKKTEDNTNAERQRRYRNKKNASRGDDVTKDRNAPVVPLRHGPESETESESESESETETEKDSARPDTERVAAREVLEPADSAAAELSATEPIEGLTPGQPKAGGSDPAPCGAELEPPNPAVAVIAAFDAERARVFGADQARAHPNATDLGVAKAMLDGGADLETCRFVFRATFERQKAAGKRPAALLRYMRDPVAEALADPLAIPEKFRRTGTGARLRNPSDVQREGRIESYRRAGAEGRTPYWQDDWGAPPPAEADG